MCRDCGYIPKCQNCDISYSYHFGKNLDLVCHHCLKKETLSPFCPKCRSSRYKFVGIGMLKIEAEIKKQFKQAKISIYDAETKILDNDFDILITTQAVFNQPDINNIELTGILNIDSILNLPDFRSNERAWQIITNLKSISKKLIIQTYNPDIYTNLINYDTFYTHELENRKSLEYPPYSQLIKLIFQHYNNQLAKNEAVTLINKLKKKINSNIKVLGPLPSYVPKIRGQFRWYVVLKIPLDVSEQKKQEIMSNIPDDWLIDVNPESLL